MMEYYGLCIKRALFIKWWLGVLNIALLVAGLIGPWLLYRHQDWPAQYQAWFSVILYCYIPIGAAMAIIVLRLLISPFLLHRDSKIGHTQAVSGLVASHQSALSSVIKERDEARQQLESRNPDFDYDSPRSRITTSFSWDGQKMLATVTLYLEFLNIGDAAAHNTKLDVYACWLATPANVIVNSMPPIPGRIAVNRSVAIQFTISQTAANLGIDRQGQVVWGFGDPQMALCFEIESDVVGPGAASRKHHNEPVLLAWSSYFPNILAFQTPEMRRAVESHIERVKSERQTGRLL